MMSDGHPLLRVMKRPAVCLWWGLAVVALVGCQAASVPARQARAAHTTVCQAYFSPGGGCTEVVVRVLRDAKNTVLVQAYSFTSAPIADALIDAFQRGVTVAVILDKSQQAERYSMVRRLAASGTPVSIDGAHAIAHNKVMVVDGETVITGSFNFTKGAEERNAENLLVIRDRDLAAQYEANWRSHLSHSNRYRISNREAAVR